MPKAKKTENIKQNARNGSDIIRFINFKGLFLNKTPNVSSKRNVFSKAEKSITILLIESTEGP